MSGIDHPMGSRGPIGLTLWAGAQLAFLCALSAVVLRQIFDLAHVGADTGVGLLQCCFPAMGIALWLQMVRGRSIGSGFVLPSVFSLIFMRASIDALEVGGVGMLGGMVLIAAVTQLVMAQFFGSLKRFFPPIIGAVILLVVGMDVGVIGVEGVFALKEHRVLGFAQVMHYAVPGIVTLSVLLALSVWVKGKKRALAIAVALASGMLLALWTEPALFGRFVEAVSQPSVGLPDWHWTPWQWKQDLMVSFVVAGMASSMATLSALQEAFTMNRKDQISPDGAAEVGTLRSEGLGNLLAAALGLSGLSGSPVRLRACQTLGIATVGVGVVTGGLLLLLGGIPLVARLVYQIPPSVVGALFIFMSTVLITEAFRRIGVIRLDLRRGLLLGLSLVAALCVLLFPARAAELPIWLKPFFHTMLSAAVTVGLALNLLLRLKATRLLTVSIALEDWQGVVKDLENRLDDWQISLPLVERSGADLQSLQKILQTADAHQIVLDLAADDFSLSFILYYSGAPLHLPGSWLADHVGVETVGERQRVTLDYQA